jgi:hypothetical protein
VEAINDVALGQKVIEEVTIGFFIIDRDDRKARGNKHIWQHVTHDAVMPLIRAHRRVDNVVNSNLTPCPAWEIILPNNDALYIADAILRDIARVQIINERPLLRNRVSALICLAYASYSCLLPILRHLPFPPAILYTSYASSLRLFD